MPAGRGRGREEDEAGGVGSPRQARSVFFDGASSTRAEARLSGFVSKSSATQVRGRLDEGRDDLPRDGLREDGERDAARLPRRAARAFAAGPFLHEDLGFADLHLYMVVDMIKEGQFDYVPAAYMDGFPGLAKSFEAVKAHPLVAEYLAAYPN